MTTEEIKNIDKRLDNIERAIIALKDAVNVQNTEHVRFKTQVVTFVQVGSIVIAVFAFVVKVVFNA
jgi:uncharacterized membrane protein